MKKVIGGEFAYPALVVGVVVASVLGYFFTHNEAATVEAEQVVPPSSQTKVDVVVDKNVSYPVAGVVDSKKVITIRAKQSGVIQLLPVVEGDVVEVGDLLSLSVSPVLNAKLAVSKESAAVRNLAEESTVLAKRAAIDVTDAYVYEAVGLKALTETTSESVKTAARANALALIKGADAFYSSLFAFVSDNPGYFSAPSLRTYDELLKAWYGFSPDYVRVGLVSPSTNDSLRARVLAADRATDEATVQTLLEDLSLLNSKAGDLLAIAEPEFFDEDKLSRQSEEYVVFQTYRSEVAAQGGTLASLQSALTSAYANADTSSLSLDRALIETEVNASLAHVEAELGEEIFQAVQSLGAAERALVLAEIAEGEHRAPTAAVVQAVLVEEGEYVTLGQPLLTIIVPDDIEMKVSVPVVLRNYVEIGTPFLIGGETVGVVDRIVPGVVDGATTMYLSFTKPLPIGQTIHGNLSFVTVEDNPLYQVSRRDLFFGVSGPYIKTASGETIAVTIVFDAGDTLMVTAVSPVPEILVPAVGVRL